MTKDMTLRANDTRKLLEMTLLLALRPAFMEIGPVKDRYLDLRIIQSRDVRGISIPGTLFGQSVTTASESCPGRSEESVLLRWIISQDKRQHQLAGLSRCGTRREAGYHEEVRTSGSVQANSLIPFLAANSSAEQARIDSSFNVGDLTCRSNGFCQLDVFPHYTLISLEDPASYTPRASNHLFDCAVFPKPRQTVDRGIGQRKFNRYLHPLFGPVLFVEVTQEVLVAIQINEARLGSGHACVQPCLPSTAVSLTLLLRFEREGGHPSHQGLLSPTPVTRGNLKHESGDTPRKCVGLGKLLQSKGF
ncbi:uncharacterized protein EDB91DRAFT_1085234 [Suillus paluster]|uniref:uncharacterized protein n=1 Tax=Suillus paluster TaxID=48578 RepID=UPI001B87F686|nr:uncharacterized protein EDB91DRAFT_1085234 [Suillus paluster]KAG1730940.1 hypothetical protein EDB91DRAFT_1085234 [Suillus paluster]